MLQGLEGGKCRAAFKALPGEVRVSSLQKDVASTLQDMGQVFEMEYIDPHSGYSVDIVREHSLTSFLTETLRNDSISPSFVGSLVRHFMCTLWCGKHS